MCVCSVFYLVVCVRVVPRWSISLPSGQSQPWDDLSSACLSIIDRLSRGLSSGLPMATDSPPLLTLGQAVQPFDGGPPGCECAPVGWGPVCV